MTRGSLVRFNGRRRIYTVRAVRRVSTGVEVLLRGPHECRPRPSRPRKRALDLYEGFISARDLHEVSRQTP
jgi:hypothetical protein